MSITYANQKENPRGVYFEATGDGATTALTVTHHRAVPTGATASAFAVVSPTTPFTETPSGRAGFQFPTDGTAVTVSSVSVTATQITVNTSAAVGLSAVAYVAVVFDQETASN